MKLRDLIVNLVKPATSGSTDVEVKHLTADSREVEQGSAFIATRGAADGHDFIDQAIENGASVIVAETAPNSTQEKQASWVHVGDTKDALAILADTFCSSPSAEFKVAGVTGTNGKTTTTYLIHHVMKSHWMRAGVIGTIKFDDGAEERDATHTTPGAIALQTLLRDMVDNGCRGVAMEVSSHGLEQNRVGNVLFDVGVFTNLTQDHLDYHGSMDKYFDAKCELFENMIANQDQKKKSVAVVNLDDAYGERVIKRIDERMTVWTFGMGAHCDFKMSKIRQNFRGTNFQLEVKGKSYLVRVPLIGRFNVYNVVAAIAACSASGIKVRDAVKALAEAPQVPGRMEFVGGKDGMNVFVDYAHTPDALRNACATLQGLDPDKLITVFGCGGDRDRTKRRPMGEAAAENSDFCIITSDNPRSEDPAEIIKMVEPGMGAKPFKSIVDRAEAIKSAIELAKRNEVVLIAGKGHEAYQQFAEETIDFDDCKVARQYIREKADEPEPVRKPRPPRDDDDRYDNRTRNDGDERRPRRDDGDDRGPRRDDRGPRKFSGDNDRGERRPRREDGDDRGPRKFSRDNNRGDSRPRREGEGGENRPKYGSRDTRTPNKFSRDDNRGDRRPRSDSRDDRGPRKFSRDDDRKDRRPRPDRKDDRPRKPFRKDEDK